MKNTRTVSNTVVTVLVSDWMQVPSDAIAVISRPSRRIQ